MIRRQAVADRPPIVATGSMPGRGTIGCVATLRTGRAAGAIGPATGPDAWEVGTTDAAVASVADRSLPVVRHHRVAGRNLPAVDCQAVDPILHGAARQDVDRILVAEAHRVEVQILPVVVRRAVALILAAAAHPSANRQDLRVTIAAVHRTVDRSSIDVVRRTADPTWLDEIWIAETDRRDRIGETAVPTVVDSPAMQAAAAEMAIGRPTSIVVWTNLSVKCEL